MRLEATTFCKTCGTPNYAQSVLGAAHTDHEIVPAWIAAVFCLNTELAKEDSSYLHTSLHATRTRHLWFADEESAQRHASYDMIAVF